MIDLSDTFLRNYDSEIQTHRNESYKGNDGSKKQNTVDSLDVSLSKLKLILEQENAPDLAPLFQVILPPEAMIGEPSPRTYQGDYINHPGTLGEGNPRRMGREVVKSLVSLEDKHRMTSEWISNYMGNRGKLN